MNNFCTVIKWFHIQKELESTENITIVTEENSSTLTITFVTDEHEGYYTCKAINEIGMSICRAKIVISTTALVEEVPIVKPKPIKKKLIKKVKPEKHISKIEVKQNVHKTEDVSSVTSLIIKKQVIEEISIEEENTTTTTKSYNKSTITNIDMAKKTAEVNEILEMIKAPEFGPGETPLRELATIGYLVRQGISVSEIYDLYNTDKFPSLQMPESQSALVQLVEREGHAKLISEVLTEETIEDETVMAATVGFRAFLKMIELKHVTVEEVITHFSRDDFITQEWKTIEASEV